MSKIRVFITVDTEPSIGGAFKSPQNKPVGSGRRIFGKIDGKYYGIPLMMDIAEHYGIRLSFFIEVLNKYFFGTSETREVCEYVLNRNHDIQLHIHPNYRNFTLSDPGQVKFSDLIGDYPLSIQIELLEEARELLVQYGVSHPVAFRAGCFGASLETVAALGETGFLVDSSFNKAYLRSSCLMPDLRINDIAPLDQIYELPITNFVEFPEIGGERYKPLDINGVSFEEMKAFLDNAVIKGPKSITILLHSFSFVKAYDVQYTRMRVRQNVIRRMERLCRYLAENQHKFEVSTFDGLDRQQVEKMALISCHEVPRMHSYLSLWRGFEQLIDRF
jgi:hypothetical protein